jgi:hypothetical protein
MPIQLAGTAFPFWCSLIPGVPNLEIPNVDQTGRLVNATLAGNPVSGAFNEGTNEITFIQFQEMVEGLALSYQFDGYVWEQPIPNQVPSPVPWMAGILQTIWTPVIITPWPSVRLAEPPAGTPAPRRRSRGVGGLSRVPA